MEQETILKEILLALRLHSERNEKQLQQLDSKIDKLKVELEKKMEKGFDHLGKKIDGVRADLADTQETTDFVLNKVVKHDKILRQLTEQM